MWDPEFESQEPKWAPVIPAHPWRDGKQTGEVPEAHGPVGLIKQKNKRPHPKGGGNWRLATWVYGMTATRCTHIHIVQILLGNGVTWPWWSSGPPVSWTCEDNQLCLPEPRLVSPAMTHLIKEHKTPPNLKPGSVRKLSSPKSYLFLWKRKTLIFCFPKWY